MEVAPVKKDSHIIRLLKLTLKIAVTLVCFWYISRKIDFTRAREAVMQADWWWLFLAVIAYALSKYISAIRLNIYFKNIAIQLTPKKNLKLYWLGMFYNLFLPGAISGDAYKVVLLNRRYPVNYKKITAAVLLDRFSGLTALGLILAAYSFTVLNNSLYKTILIAGSLLAILLLFVVIKKFFPDFLPGFWPTFFWGLAVQCIQVTGVYGIMAALNIPLHQVEWIVIFLASAIITVIPISLGGGLGTRELVFVEGARYFGLDVHVAPVISILFYLTSVLSSVWGAYYIYHDPLEER